MTSGLEIVQQHSQAAMRSSIEILKQAEAMRPSMLQHATMMRPPMLEQVRQALQRAAADRDTFGCSAVVLRVPIAPRRAARAFDSGSPEPAEPPRRHPGFAPWETPHRGTGG